MRSWGRILVLTGLLLIAAAVVLAVCNIRQDASAGSAAESVLERLETEIPAQTVPSEVVSDSAETAVETYIPDYVLNPEMDMPEREMNGQSYIGILSIPSLSLELPIIGKWSYDALKISPCRYAGSAYQDDLVIAGHNYRSHFGSLGDLSPGDKITFTDTDGNLFSYEVVELETLSAYAIEDMLGGGWDLTLFTCTLSGEYRVTVRCELVGSGD